MAKLTTYPEIAGRETVSILEDHEGTIWVGEWQAPQGRLCAIRTERSNAMERTGVLGGALSAYMRQQKANFGSEVLEAFGAGNQTDPNSTPWEQKHGCHLIRRRYRWSTLNRGRGHGIWRLVDGAIEEHPYNAAKLRARADSVPIAERSRWSFVDWDLRWGAGSCHQPRTDVLTQSEGLSGNSINAVFQDREGSIWVATTDGLTAFEILPSLDGRCSRDCRSRLAAQFWRRGTEVSGRAVRTA